MPPVLSYAKNQGLNFRIPYEFEGQARNYVPDYLIRLDDGGPEPLTLILEVSGEAKKEKRAKVDAARDLWVPAVNNSGRFGRWAFLEVSAPWDAATLNVIFFIPAGIAVLVAAAAAVVSSATPRLTEKLAQFVPDGAGRLVPWLVLAAGVLVAASVVIQRRARGDRVRLARNAACMVLAAFLVVHLALRPVIDPARDMSAGAREVAALVPAGEPLLGFSADETTRAVIPFYSKRILANVEKVPEVMAAFDSGTTRHLVVMDKEVRKLTPALLDRIELVKAVRLNATRVLNVYVLTR